MGAATRLSASGVLALAVALGAAPASAQEDAEGGALTTAGIYRASARVDSVFIDRLVPETSVAPGDFGAYLLARVGVIPIPPDLRLTVRVDSTRITLHGTIGDLPLEARRELGPILAMFPPSTSLLGVIDLDKVAREVVRFRLAGIRVNGVPIPEGVVGAVMLDVGRRYPVLGRSGRDLFVEIPMDAEVVLAPGVVRLIGPPDVERP